ncbi:MAG: hypothetical protein AAF961_13730 [Planctomycetota bacterium]
MSTRRDAENCQLGGASALVRLRCGDYPESGRAAARGDGNLRMLWFRDAQNAHRISTTLDGRRLIFRTHVRFRRHFAS